MCDSFSLHFGKKSNVLDDSDDEDRNYASKSKRLRPLRKQKHENRVFGPLSSNYVTHPSESSAVSNTESNMSETNAYDDLYIDYVRFSS